MAGQLGFWSVEERLAEISAQGDPLEALASTVNFEMFRPVLEKALGTTPRWKGGRPGFDPVLRFRMLVLQSLHGLSLEATEYLVRDRLSWMRFCRLGPEDRVPDANTLWDFREAMIRAGALDDLFAELDRAITAAGYLPRGGQILFEITARNRAERELERQRSELARQYGELETLCDTTLVGLALHDRGLRWIRINKRLAEINGFAVEEDIGREPRELLPGVEDRVEALIRGVFEGGRPVLGVEVHGTTPAEPDTPRTWIADYYPVFSEGEVFAVGTCVREVTREVRMVEEITAANEQQRILLGELQHRVKNTLATVSAMSRFLIRGADTPEAFHRRLSERLQAMSRAHEALTRTNWTTVSLRELLRREAEPYGTEGAVLRIEGPDLDLSPEEALNLSMAMHETMTNAAKHGALSAPGGEIAVRVSRAEGGDGPSRRIEWTESGGPEVAPAEGPGGFGTLLLGRILGPGLGGRVEIDPRPEGMRYVIEF